ncbi:MAG: hypothetical protein K6A43_12245 [Treponema sp.]|nr:hypothetical protein [Treponema sp.]
MEFYSDSACTIKVGTLKEYPYVIMGLTSKLYGTSNQINVNATYTITYMKGTETFTGFANGYTAPSQFSRITSVQALPVSNNLASSVTDTETFLGWYKDAAFTDGPITSIATNTIVQNLTLYGKFISINEVPTAQGVTFKYDSADSPSESTFKVGHTLTATPYFTNNSTQTSFLGTISSWKWYYGEGESWTAIADSEVTNTDTSPALDTTPATSSIKLRPAYAGKKIKVELVQKYTITDTDSNGGWEIAENISDGTAVAGKTKSTTTPADNSVALGTLNVNDIAVKYTTTTVIGQSITNNFAIDTGSAKDANTTSWTYPTSDITVTYVGTEDVAPNSSATGNYQIKFSRAGYNDETVSKSAFVNVKAEAPDVSGALVNDPTRIEYGKIAFAITGKTLTYRTTEWEYSTNGGTSWTAVTTSGTSAEITKPSQLHVRTKVIGTENSEGYVAPSEKVAVSIDDDSNVGTKVVIGSVTVGHNSDASTPAMGDTLTANAVSAIEGQGIKIGVGIGTITWVWKADGTAIHTEENTTSITSTYQLANVGTCYNKAITVEAQYHYLAAGEASLIAGEKNITKDKGAGTVGKGNLTNNSYTLSYFGGHPSPVGQSLASNKLSFVSGTMTNKLNNVVLSSMSGATFSFADGAVVPEVTGNVDVTAHITGYKDITFSVQIIAMPVAPNPSQTAGNTNPLISRDVTKIPHGAILFVNGGDGIQLSDIEYCYAEDLQSGSDTAIDETPAENYHPIPVNQPLFNKGNTYFGNKTSIYIRYKATEYKQASLPTRIDLYSDESADYVNIGTRKTTITISVAAESTIQLSASGTTLTASGMKSGASCTWFVDDVQVEGATGSSYTLNRTLTGVYAVRVESINDQGEKISATATVTVQ